MSTNATENSAEVSPGDRQASAEEVRAVAEDARETEWKAPSFVKELFAGRLALELVHPWPEIDDEELERAKPWLDKLERFLRDNVDGDAIDRESRVPQHVIDGLRELGCFGIKIPKEYGGLGFSQAVYSRAISMMASVDAGVTTMVSAHQSIGVPAPLLLFGTSEQKKKYLPKLAGGAISAFALTEEAVGSDPARMTTTAVLSDDGTEYVLNGEKLWCTNATVAELVVVMARTGERKISAFIVHTDWPGVEVTHRCRFMGVKGIENGILRFDNVRVPVENRLWGEGQGLKLALITLNTGRLAVPATCSAAVKRCLEAAREFSKSRIQWGRPVGKHDAVAQMLGFVAANAYAIDAMQEITGLLSDRGGADIRLEAAISKMWTSERGWETIDAAHQICGGRAYETADSLKARGADPLPIERTMRDFRVTRILEGSTQVLKLFIVREALDTHLKVAGPLANPKATLAQKVPALIKALLYYAAWYPARWLGWGWWPRYAQFGKLSGHMRWVNRRSRKLARMLFYAMMRYGAKLERRQAVLARLVDIGAELFAMVAACAKAQSLRTSSNAEERGQAASAIHMAEGFCRMSRRMIDADFRGVFHNDDQPIYELAQRVMGDEVKWMEERDMVRKADERKGGRSDGR
jgi:alkylation response protein AidB-like acyl-CoA dehydrogenase